MAGEGVEQVKKEPKKTPFFGQIVRELQQTAVQKRRNILRKIEEREEGKERRVLAFITNVEQREAAILATDAAMVANVLQQVGRPEHLELIIHSGGGLGTAAEKIIDTCRNHTRLDFVVMVPNMAKSAATMICLGADKILMGPLSELGPIDAQVQVNVHGVTQPISAQSFIDARDNLVKAVQQSRGKGEDPTPFLQQLASMNIPFVEQCQRLMEYGKELAERNLASYMLAHTMPDASQEERRKKAKKIAAFFSSPDVHKIHGGLIKPHACKKQGLNVEELDESNSLWQLVFEYYMRCQVAFVTGDPKRRPFKMIESSSVTMTAQAGP